MPNYIDNKIYNKYLIDVDSVWKKGQKNKLNFEGIQ